MNDNVFGLDAYRRSKADLPIAPSTSLRKTRKADRIASIDYITWSKDIRLRSEPSLTVRSTALNVLSDLRVHPVTRVTGRQRVVIELRLDLLQYEQLKQVDFMERSTQLISRLLGYEIYLAQQDDILVYTTTHPSPR